MAQGTRALRSMTLALTVAAVFGAWTAGSASAFEWSIEGKTLTQRGLLDELVGGTGGLFKIALPGKFATRAECKVLSSVSDIFPGGTGKTTLKFKACKTFSGNTELPACAPEEPILTIVKTALFASGETLYNELAPAEPGLPLIQVILSEECALPEQELKVTGTAAGAINGPGVEALEQPIQFTEGPMIGSATQKLIDLHIGKTWGVVE